MKKYEAVFILDDQRLDGEANSFVERLFGVVKELGGEVTSSSDMEQRQLAHPIRKKSIGHYWDFVIDLDEDKVAKLKDKFRLDASVLRMEVFVYEEPPAPKVVAAGEVNENDDSPE